jgi:hypothetical protein
LFHLLGTLRDHGTRLFDLRAKKDLTERDFTTELLAVVNSFKSERELQDIAYRSLRTRVNNFQANGSWPTGTHPYGYGKQCLDAAGKVLWEWQPVNRSFGQLFYPNAKGVLVAAPGQDHVKLVPSNNPNTVRAVKLIFDLYTRLGLSRRQIALRLNAEGLTFNKGPFSHPDITNILQNPVYTGDTVFGKRQSGELHTFDANGVLVEVKQRRKRKERPLADCLVKRDTHEALIDRKTWELAQNKLKAERDRLNPVGWSPRDSKYFLKQLFVCGHCGKNMTGRTETDPSTGRKTIIYVCSSYIAGRCNGHPVECGYQRITHRDAELLLQEKIAELNLAYDASRSHVARQNLKSRLAHLRRQDADKHEEWRVAFEAGVDAFAEYLNETYPDLRSDVFRKLRKLATEFYLGGIEKQPVAGLPFTLERFRNAVREAEEVAVKSAKKKLAALETEHAAYTRAWVNTTSDLQRSVLKQDMDRLEGEINDWKRRTVSITQRLNEVYAAEAEQAADRQKLLSEWPSLERREKGEAMRRLFNKVTLFWDRVFRPAIAHRSRPRRTNRPGRWRYTLQRDRIQWSLATTGSESSR